MRRLRILHLGFQDPRQPGSGGGAVRTREINRRLAERHDVEVLTAGWPGARPRLEDGVRWRHAPALLGRASGLPYSLSAVARARSARVDLVIEDFFPPVSTIGIPRWTSLPVVGVVQWLFADQKAEQYGLPFGAIERWGLRQHSDLVAVSGELGEQLRSRVPGARVHVVPNGVDRELRESGGRTPESRADIVYLGRIETAQKGLDVLLRAMARPQLADRREHLVIAGDGPDRVGLEQLARELGVAHRLRWVGRIEGGAKVELLRRAAVVVVPSRYETFGMVAAEAMACGAPVVATDIACLREVVVPGAGLLVPSEDPAALAAAVVTVLGGAAEGMGEVGRVASARYDWDALAAEQEAVYLAAVERGRP